MDWEATQRRPSPPQRDTFAADPPSLWRGRSAIWDSTKRLSWTFSEYQQSSMASMMMRFSHAEIGILILRWRSFMRGGTTLVALVRFGGMQIQNI